MHFSNAAVFLLSALQPALAKPTLLHRADGRSQNRVSSQWLTATKTVINYFYRDPVCGNTKAWVGVYNSYRGDLKAWQYIEPASGVSNVRFDNTKLGVGEYQAAFFCEDGKRSPWMVSETFKVDAAPPEVKDQCVHRQSIYNSAWTYTACDVITKSCSLDCGFLRICDTCDDCRDQCNNRPKDD